MLDTILFDLDGTLLPMDYDGFLHLYMSNLGKTFQPKGYDPVKLQKSVWVGTEAMVRNDGTKTNCERFWETFSREMGEDMAGREEEFTVFYRNEFKEAKKACALQPLAKEAAYLLKEKGYHLILATNPLFPVIATEQRIAWAGLSPEDFELVTTYEEERFCKPNPLYYQSILERFGKNPEDCLMVGNDVDEDMCAAKLGIDCYLITDCLLNKREKSLDPYKKGTFAEFMDYVRALPSIK